MEKGLNGVNFFTRSICENSMFDIHYKTLTEGHNLYEQYSKDEQVVYAEYVASNSDCHNPYIESIPLPRSLKDLETDFTQPVYSYNEEELGDMSLSEKLENIVMLREQFRIMLPFHENLDRAIYQALIKGYRNRRVSFDGSSINKTTNADFNNNSPVKMYKDPLHLESYGSFNVEGYGGTGKSLALSIIMSHYKQVVIHRLKGGGEIYQILYLIVQCPPNGNMSAFYSNIGKAVDTAIGYTYPAFQKRIDQVRSLGEKLNIVINIIERFNIGLIIFDEIQMFLTSKNSNHERVNVKTESFQAITTIMNSTGVSIGVIGTEIAYRLIFEDQIHQNRRLGKTIYADSYCSNQSTFMRILNALIDYQWTDVKITKEDLTPDLLKAFMDCTHGIIDLIIGLYSALQHEALITDRKTKINESFVRKVAKKYYPNLMKTIDNIGASDYDRTRLAEIEEASKLMKKDISKQSEIEHERTISKIKNKPSDKDMLIKSAVAKITAVSDDFKVSSIIDVSKELYETGNYSVTDEKQFTRDVMKVLSGKKIRAKKKPDRMSKDVMMQFLDNSTQDTN